MIYLKSQIDQSWRSSVFYPHHTVTAVIENLQHAVQQFFPEWAAVINCQVFLKLGVLTALSLRQVFVRAVARVQYA